MSDKLDSWDSFAGNYLKAENVKSESEAFVICDVKVVEREDNGTKKTILSLTLENGGCQYVFDLNKTNASKLKELGVQNPRNLFGKIVYFRKALVRDPKKNKEVEGLRIFQIK